VNEDPAAFVLQLFATGLFSEPCFG